MENKIGFKHDISTELNIFDLQSLRRSTNSSISKEDSLKQAVEQFEGIFIRQLLSSMRKVNDVFKEDGMFDSSTSDFYQGMWDDQIASSLSSQQNNNSSISSLMLQQFGGVQRGESNLGSVNMASLVNQQIKNPAVIKAESTTDKTIIENNTQFAQISTQNSDVKLGSTVKLEPGFFDSKEEFLETLYPLAKKAAMEIGGSAKALLAQAALETGWGKFIIQDESQVSSKNLFNIKNKDDWHGAVAVKNTVEYNGEEFNLEQASFRAYQSFSESFEDFINFLKGGSRYQEVVENASNPEQYFKQLQRAGYATDPEYATKIQKIYDSEILQKISE